jgi:hypothetical protein
MVRSLQSLPGPLLLVDLGLDTCSSSRPAVAALFLYLSRKATGPPHRGCRIGHASLSPLALLVPAGPTAAPGVSGATEFRPNGLLTPSFG